MNERLPGKPELGKKENPRQAGMEPETAIVDRHLPVTGMRGL